MMEHRSADPYEQQLQKVFDSYDYENRGSLDREGLTQLCHSLQLEEQGTELIKCLLKDPKRPRATFPEFKEALLALLGNVQNNKASLSDEDRTPENTSPEREVSPKFVYGSKKYGRRSRPRSDEITPEKEQNENTNYINSTKYNIAVQKSNSQSDMSFSKKRKTNAKLKRCTSFPGNNDYDYRERSLGNHYITCNNLNDEQEFVCTEDMLRAAWNKLGVGKDGYLNQTELVLVCDAIGLHKLANGVLRQLSGKLSPDLNRRISFQELLEALQQDDAWSDVFNCTIQSTTSTTDPLNLSMSCLSDDSVFYQNGSMVQYITLGPDGTGLISTDMVIDMWENAGITSPKLLLSDLGFNSSQINIVELATVLEKEIKGMSENTSDYSNPHIALLQAFLTIYQSEIKCLRSILEQMHAEREKLKNDVIEANNRATLLAQEVDDNHAKMEQNTQNQVKLLEHRHADILKELTEQFNGEKEHMALVNKSLEERISCLESEENKLRTDLELAQKYSNSLEKENLQLRNEILDLHKIKNALAEEIAALENEKQKCHELEKEQIEPLLKKLSCLQVENSKLRDRNDEMLCEIENLSSQVASMRHKISSTPTFNNLEQSMEDNAPGIAEGLGVGAKRRNDESPSKDIHDFGLVDGSPRLGKVRKFQKNKDNNSEVPFTSSESGFDADLDWVDSSLSISGNEHEDTQSQLKSRIALLEQLLTQHSIPIPSNGPHNNSHTASDYSDDSRTMQLTNYCKDLELLLAEVKQSICKVTNDSCCKNCDVLKNINEKIDKKMLKESLVDSFDSSIVQNKSIDASTETDDSSDIEELKNRNKQYEDEIKDMTTKVQDLESCVELLKNEYEKCEDYWSQKLDEERQMFEQEQNQNTEKLNELVAKIIEYENQFSMHMDNRLPPIEEKYSLEKQFTDLEEEYEDYKLQMETQLEDKNREIFVLQEKIAELTTKNPYGCADVEVQVDLLENSLKVNSIDNKMCNLSNHVIESTNLFSSDTMPFGWNSNQNCSGEHSLETPVVDNSKQRDFRNSAYTWSKSVSSEDMTNGDTVSLNNSNCSSHGCETNSENTSTSLPLNIVWQNAQHNIKASSFSLLNLPASTENNASPNNSTPCRPKRTRKHDRSPLAAQRLHKKGSNQDKEVKVQNDDSAVPTKWKSLVDVTNRIEDQTCVVSVSTIHNLNARVHHLEQRCRHFQIMLKQQHYQAEQMLQHCWHQHRIEKTELQFLLKNSHEKLEHQFKYANEQQEKLARTDMLVKELYVENSYLIAQVQRLEQQCHMLAQCNSSSSSV